MHAVASIRRRIILVHGTFASEAGWTKVDSTFVRELTNGLDGENEVVRFTWSGANNFGARDRAVSELRSLLKSTDSGTQQFIIAHSHGGNIAVNSLSEPAIAQLISGVVCLSTPFLHLRPRKWDRSVSTGLGVASFLALCFLIFILLFALEAFIRWCCISWMDSHPDLSNAIKGVVVVILLFVTPSVLFSVFEKHISAVRHAASCAVPSNLRLLIIRLATDEAGALLTAAQFVSWLTGKVYAQIDRVVAGLGSHFLDEDESEEPKSAIRTVLETILKKIWSVLLIVFMVGAFVHFVLKWFLDAQSLSRLVRWLGYPIEAIFVLIGIASVPGVLALCFLVVIMVMSLVFGYDAMLAAFYYDISVEPSPPGSWTIHVLPVDVQKMQEGMKRLTHSSYEDLRVLGLVKKWIQSSNGDFRSF